MRRTWIVMGTLAAVLAIGLTVLSVIALVAREEVTEEATFPVAGLARLEVRSDDGTVEVVGGDVDEVTLVAEISHGLRRADHQAEVDGDTLRVRGRCPMLAPINAWCGVDYRLVVPAHLVVDARSDNGRVAVRDLDGDVVARTSNGRIDLARLGGTVEARTSNGRIDASGLSGPVVEARTSNGRVELGFAEAPTTVTARSSNGSVGVVVPDDEDDVAYRVEVDTSNGSTDAAVRTDPASDRSITATTSNGSVTVRYPTG